MAPGRPGSKDISCLIRKLGKLVAHVGGAEAGGGGRTPAGRGGIAPAVRAGGFRVPLGVTEIDVIGNHLGTAALVAVLVRPVADLEAALHHGHAALGEVAADKLAGLPPGNHINEIGGAVAGGLVLKVPVHCQREGGHSRPGLGVPELGVTGQTTHEDDLVEHMPASLTGPCRRSGNASRCR